MQTASISLIVKPTFLTIYLYNMTQVSGRDYMDSICKCFFRFIRKRHIYVSVALMNNPSKYFYGPSTFKNLKSESS